MIDNLIDIRDQLARNFDGGPNRAIDPTRKHAVVIHYFGPPVTATDPLAYFQGIATYHAFVRDWSSEAGLQRGDGIMYHLGIWQDGGIYQLRDVTAVLWHCGTDLNTYGYAVHCAIGGDQRASAAMLASLWHVGHHFLGRGVPRARFFGHQEVSPTSCPGTLMTDFVYPWRAGEQGGDDMTDGRWFAPHETGQPEGHFVGGGFWQFWQAHGGLLAFGYPLTDERPEICPDGVQRTVQWFERACFEYHPDQPEPYRVLPRRLGAMALAAG